MSVVLNEFCESCNASFEPTPERPYWCSWTCEDNVRRPNLPVIGAGADEAAAWLAEHGRAWSVRRASHRRPR